MSLSEKPQPLKLSHRDWPWPTRKNDPLTIYRRSIEIFLGTNLLPQSPLIDASLQVFDNYTQQMQGVARWANYKVPEMGDMNCYGHTFRQAGITLQALSWGDTRFFNYNTGAVDAITAASILHDLGETRIGDITYDLKQAGKTAIEKAETQAVFEMIDAVQDLEGAERDVLKNIYARITTGLTDETFRELGLEKSASNKIPWDSLRKTFKLYERYGYLVTAIQQWPFKLSQTEEGFSKEDLVILRSWNRSELESALITEEDVPTDIKAAVLFRNVVLNQWPYILQAHSEGVPSTTTFFNNSLTKLVIKSANNIMELDLDEGIFI